MIVIIIINGNDNYNANEPLESLNYTLLSLYNAETVSCFVFVSADGAVQACPMCSDDGERYNAQEEES